MASLTFPSDIPSPVIGGLTRTPVNNFVQDKSEIGRGRRRRRMTGTFSNWSYQTPPMTAAQKDALETFAFTTTNGAIEPFNWTHPTTSVIYEVQFQDMPIVENMGPDIWTASFVLEQLS